MTTYQQVYQSVLNKILRPQLRLKNNAHLIIRAAEQGYDLKTIEHLLKFTPQTQALLPQQRKQNLHDCFAFAQVISGNYVNGENYMLRSDLNDKVYISLSEIFHAIAYPRKKRTLFVYRQKNNIEFKFCIFDECGWIKCDNSDFLALQLCFESGKKKCFSD